MKRHERFPLSRMHFDILKIRSSQYKSRLFFLMSAPRQYFEDFVIFEIILVVENYSVYSNLVLLQLLFRSELGSICLDRLRHLLCQSREAVKSASSDHSIERP